VGKGHDRRKYKPKHTHSCGLQKLEKVSGINFDKTALVLAYKNGQSSERLMGSARMARATMYSNTECTDPDVFVCVCDGW